MLSTTPYSSPISLTEVDSSQSKSPVISLDQFSIYTEFQQITTSFKDLENKTFNLLSRIAACTEEMQIWAQVCTLTPPNEQIKAEAYLKLTRYNNIVAAETSYHAKLAKHLTIRITTALNSAQAITMEDERNITVHSRAISVHQYCQDHVIPLLKDWNNLCTGWTKRVELITTKDSPSFSQAREALEQALDPNNTLGSLFESSLAFVKSFGTKEDLSPAPFDSRLQLTNPWCDWYDVKATYSLPLDMRKNLAFIKAAISSLSDFSKKNETWAAFAKEWMDYEKAQGNDVLTRISYLENNIMSEGEKCSLTLIKHREALSNLILSDLSHKLDILKHAEDKAQTEQEQKPLTPLIPTNVGNVIKAIQTTPGAESMPVLNNLVQELSTILAIGSSKSGLSCPQNNVDLLQHQLVELNTLLKSIIK